MTPVDDKFREQAVALAKNTLRTSPDLFGIVRESLDLALHQPFAESLPPTVAEKLRVMVAAFDSEQAPHSLSGATQESEG